MTLGVTRSLVGGALKTASSARVCHACMARRSIASISASSAGAPRSSSGQVARAAWSGRPTAISISWTGFAGRHSRSATTLASRSTPAGSGPPPVASSSLAAAGSARIRVVPPSLDAIKEEGYMDDAQLLPEAQANLVITPEAISQLEKITAREPPDVLEKGTLALRVGVESGGCHGYQYTMAITEDRGVDDYVFEFEGVRAIPVVVDLVSLGLLKGSTLHHATELIGSSFRIQDNPQAREGGACGCGVSWELKPASG